MWQGLAQILDYLLLRLQSQFTTHPARATDMLNHERLQARSLAGGHLHDRLLKLLKLLDFHTVKPRCLKPKMLELRMHAKHSEHLARFLAGQLQTEQEQSLDRCVTLKHWH